MRIRALLQFGLIAGLISNLAIGVQSAQAQDADTEPAIEPSAASVLGADVKGENWTVSPLVESDGFIRRYSVETPYGKFNVFTQKRMSERLRELRALQTLEKMSRWSQILWRPPPTSSPVWARRSITS